MPGCELQVPLISFAFNVKCICVIIVLHLIHGFSSALGITPGLLGFMLLQQKLFLLSSFACTVYNLVVFTFASSCVVLTYSTFLSKVSHPWLSVIFLLLMLRVFVFWNWSRSPFSGTSCVGGASFSSTALLDSIHGIEVLLWSSKCSVLYSLHCPFFPYLVVMRAAVEWIWNSWIFKVYLWRTLVKLVCENNYLQRYALS